MKWIWRMAVITLMAVLVAACNTLSDAKATSESGIPSSSYRESKLIQEDLGTRLTIGQKTTIEEVEAAIAALGFVKKDLGLPEIYAFMVDEGGWYHKDNQHAATWATPDGLMEISIGLGAEFEVIDIWIRTVDYPDTVEELRNLESLEIFKLLRAQPDDELQDKVDDARLVVAEKTETDWFSSGEQGIRLGFKRSQIVTAYGEPQAECSLWPSGHTMIYNLENIALTVYLLRDVVVGLETAQRSDWYVIPQEGKDQLTKIGLLQLKALPGDSVEETAQAVTEDLNRRGILVQKEVKETPFSAFADAEYFYVGDGGIRLKLVNDDLVPGTIGAIGLNAKAWNYKWAGDQEKYEQLRAISRTNTTVYDPSNISGEELLELLPTINRELESAGAVEAMIIQNENPGIEPMPGIRLGDQISVVKGVFGKPTVEHKLTVGETAWAYGYKGPTYSLWFFTEDDVITSIVISLTKRGPRYARVAGL